MKLKQLSIFLENAPDRLYEATHALGAAGINLRSLSICDTFEFGVLRILVSDLNLARRVLMEKQLPARVDDVVAAEIDDIPGSLAAVLSLFRKTQVSIVYMYALAGTGISSGRAVMVFRFSDNDRAIEILHDNNIKLISSQDFGITQHTR
jgi:hypothetical protein